MYEILFQIVSKSFLEDGNVCYILPQNTLKLLTTNTGTKWIASLCQDPELMPEPDANAKSLREPLLRVPPGPAGATGDHPLRPPQRRDAGADSRLQLNQIKQRVEACYNIPFPDTLDVVTLVVSRCTTSESGGRMIHEFRPTRCYGTSTGSR